MVQEYNFPISTVIYVYTVWEPYRKRENIFLWSFLTSIFPLHFILFYFIIVCLFVCLFVARRSIFFFIVLYRSARVSVNYPSLYLSLNCMFYVYRYINIEIISYNIYIYVYAYLSLLSFFLSILSVSTISSFLWLYSI